MGIRFACHECGKRLNIKAELAGRRGVCPGCASKFRIPLRDSETSSPVDVKPEPSPSYYSGPAAASPEVALEELDASSFRQHEPDATWYVRPPSGGQYGPAPTDLLRQWIEEGRVAASSLLWRDGWPQWRTASESFPELATRLPGAGSPGDGLTNKGPSPASDRAPGDQPGPTAMASIAAAANSTGTIATEPTVAGQSTIGAQRRVRSMRRVLWIGLLSAFAIMLVGVLVVVANRG